MDNQIFLDLGLTEGEIKVYLALLKLGENKTGALIKEAGVSSSKVYKILDRLEKKGLVGFIIKGKIKYFYAMPPKRLLEYFDEKKEDFTKKRNILENIIPKLENQINPNVTLGIVYEGYLSVTNIFKNILDELSPGEAYYVIGASYGEGGNKLKDFFKLYHAKRSKKGIIVNMLANLKEKEIIKKNIDKKSKIRYLPNYLLTNMEIVFYKNKVYFIIWTKNMLGILIENDEAVNNFRKYFDTFWEIAKE